MAKKKIGMGTIEINKKFESMEEASRYAKRLRQAVIYICKKYKYQASVMTVVSNLKKDSALLRYAYNGKRGRPKKEHILDSIITDVWYKGDYYTDWHIHVLIVSKPSYSLRNRIKEYIDKNWKEIPKMYEEKEFDISMLNKKKVYKKTCNIKMADYFINQSAEIRFVNCNFSGEKDFDYTLKDYYRESLKSFSQKKRLIKEHLEKPMTEEMYCKKYEEIERKFKLIESYFFSITKEEDDKAQKEFMNKVRLEKIKENYNKVQNRNRRELFEDDGY